MILRTIAILALVALTACGGSDASADEKPTIRVTVQWGEVSPALAVTSGMYSENPTVIVDYSTTSAALLDNVIAHELGHCAGLGHVALYDSCLMHSPTLADNPWPCAIEAPLMANFGAERRLEIVSCPTDLVTATVGGINLWNTPSAFKSFNGSQGSP